MPVTTPRGGAECTDVDDAPDMREAEEWRDEGWLVGCDGGWEGEDPSLCVGRDTERPRPAPPETEAEEVAAAAAARARSPAPVETMELRPTGEIGPSALLPGCPSTASPPAPAPAPETVTLAVAVAVAAAEASSRSVSTATSGSEWSAGPGESAITLPDVTPGVEPAAVLPYCNDRRPTDTAADGTAVEVGEACVDDTKDCIDLEVLEILEVEVAAEEGADDGLDVDSTMEAETEAEADDEVGGATLDAAPAACCWAAAMAAANATPEAAADADWPLEPEPPPPAWLRLADDAAAAAAEAEAAAWVWWWCPPRPVRADDSPEDSEPIRFRPEPRYPVTNTI